MPIQIHAALNSAGEGVPRDGRHRSNLTRSKRRTASGFIQVGLLALCMPTAIKAEAQTYTVIVIGPSSSNLAVNASGQVCFQGGLWTPDAPNDVTGSLTGIPPLPSQRNMSYYSIDAIVSGLNASGRVVGSTVFTTDRIDRKTGQDRFTTTIAATLWQNGSPSALKSPGGADTYAYCIYDSGAALGTLNNVAALWQNSNPKNLSTPAGSYSAALAVNNLAQVGGGVISSYGNVPTGFAALWQGGTLYNMGALSGYTQGARAQAINASGVAVGYA